LADNGSEQSEANWHFTHGFLGPDIPSPFLGWFCECLTEHIMMDVPPDLSGLAGGGHLRALLPGRGTSVPMRFAMVNGLISAIADGQPVTALTPAVTPVIV
jgi:hypothetical protein